MSKYTNALIVLNIVLILLNLMFNRRTLAESLLLSLVSIFFLTIGRILVKHNEKN